ncbi:hypothetical protein ACOME3_010693 [Neoechinorhynchus agilis]
MNPTKFKALSIATAILFFASSILSWASLCSNHPWSRVPDAKITIRISGHSSMSPIYFLLIEGEFPSCFFYKIAFVRRTNAHIAAYERRNRNCGFSHGRVSFSMPRTSSHIVAATFLCFWTNLFDLSTSGNRVVCFLHQREGSSILLPILFGDCKLPFLDLSLCSLPNSDVYSRHEYSQIV